MCGGGDSGGAGDGNGDGDAINPINERIMRLIEDIEILRYCVRHVLTCWLWSKEFRAAPS